MGYDLPFACANCINVGASIESLIIANFYIYFFNISVPLTHICIFLTDLNTHTTTQIT